MDTLLHKLYSRRQEGSMKCGLHNMLLLAALLGNPEKKFATVHIAGSNGKGSVATKIARGLQLAGLKTGLFTSPHIASFRERIQVNASMIPEEELSKSLSALFDLIDAHDIKATFFEITTLLSFLYFGASQVDIAVIETGLGGRLDPTNIIQPVLSIITSISLEHCDRLGNSLDAIALEKGGIIKPNTPLIMGPKVPRDPIYQLAHLQSAPCHAIDAAFECFDDENSAIAKKALELLHVDSHLISQAIAIRPPCRMEIFTDQGPEALILDVAHNPDGFHRLFTAIRKLYPKNPIRVICGMSQEKDILASMGWLKTHASHLHFIKANSARACPPELLCKTLIDLGFPKENICLAPAIKESLQAAIEGAIAHDEIVVICGSFFIMAEIRDLLY